MIITNFEFKIFADVFISRNLQCDIKRHSMTSGVWPQIKESLCPKLENKNINDVWCWVL